MRAVPISICCSIVLAAGVARAQTSPAPPPDATPIRTAVSREAGATVTGGLLTVAAGLAMYFAPAAPSDPQAHWRGGILLDEGTRDGLRLRTLDEQAIAATISDAALTTTMGLAAVVDAGIVPLVQGDLDLAWQAQFAHVLALGLMLSVGEAAKSAAQRARPYERECAADPDRPGCASEDRFASFYSLHTGMAFTSAGFSCAMHLSRSLYGDLAADASSCAASVAFATTTGLLRIASDRHYLSDVVVGAVLGFAIGYLVPLALVPERRPVPLPEPADAEDGEPIAAAPGGFVAVAPMVAPSTSGGREGIGTGGVSVMGAF